jgi:ATP-binding cassette subfamily B protein
LKNVSFEVKAGEITAIVGATGSGKSSIINILNRFYETSSGEILVDGINIKNIKQNSLRQHIGTILQDVFLFSSTIKENITLKNTDVSFDEIKSIADYTGISKFIEKLPGGYDYNVMERGYALSAGQRQLIAFLRAMVYNPQVLILDEATSAIDTDTEAILQQATEKIMRGRTGIVVAHRLSTIQNAHQILVLDNGEIIERGTHHQLLEQGGAYYNLYRMQFEKTQEIL